MSITKRFLNVARSNLNALLEKAAEAADPRRKLDTFSDDELEAELRRRRGAAEAEERVAAAKAKVDAAPRTASRTPANGAGAPPAASSSAPPPKSGPAAGTGAPPSAADREAREKAAREREARVRAAREARENAAREAEQKARTQQPRSSSSQQRSSSSQQQRGGGGRGQPRGSASEAQIAQYYKRLELPVGASFEEVKTAYRKLMRRYHPDLHTQSPEKLRAANEVAAALTQAYNELEKHLLGGPNR